MSELTERLGKIKEQEERSRTRMIQDAILKLQMDKLKMQLSESKIRQQIQEGERTEAGAAREQWAGFPEEKKTALLRRGTGEQYGPGQRRLIASDIAAGKPNIAQMIMEASKPLGPSEQWERELTPEQAGQWGMFQETPAEVKARPEVYNVLADVMGLPSIAPKPKEAEEKVWIDSSGRLVQKTDVEYDRAMEAGEVLTDNVKGYTQTFKDYYAALAQANEETKREIAKSLGYKDTGDLRAILGTASFLRQMAIEQAMQDYGKWQSRGASGEWEKSIPRGDYSKYDLSR